MHITPDEVKEVLNRDPVKIKLLTNDYIVDNRLPEIQVPNIFEPNSTKFHPLGLFSEEIFGPLTDLSRYTKEAQIDLHTHIIHPALFAYIFEKKAMYASIMSGKRYAKFDDEETKFVLTSEEDPEGGTGYNFFLKHLPKLAKAEAPESLRARNLHELLIKNKKNLLIRRLLVIPAGLRDLDIKSGRLSKDDINKMYLALLNLTTGLSKYDLSEDQIFDGIRYRIQLKVAEIFKYIENIGKGKKGFFQKHYGDRKIAYGTRNVISVSTMSADTPDHPTNLKSDETGLPLRQVVVAFHPFFVSFIKKKLYGELFLHGSAENVPVTNPKTLEMEYIAIRSAEMNRYTTSDGIDKVLSQFKYIGFRESPVSIRNLERKEYWLLLKYEVSDKIFMSKSLTDLKKLVEESREEWDKDKVKPVTWVEMLYLASLEITHDKYVMAVRYPVTGEGSIFPSKVHLLTTSPSKEVEVRIDSTVIKCFSYPILGKSYFESALVHQARMSKLGLDFDGDTMSISGIWVKESNEELSKYTRSVNSIVGSDLSLKIKADLDLVELVVHNLSA